jgi:16S rRNA (cytosine967-C5)-methyltransferase
MTPAARLQASIELLDTVLEIQRPADAAVASYLRGKRYIGSKDRQYLLERVYGLLRRYGRLKWHMKNVDLQITARRLVIADMVLTGTPANDVETMFAGVNYGPEAMTDAERKLLNWCRDRQLEDPEMPEIVMVECPPWAEKPLRLAFGDAFRDELVAQTLPGTVDLRMNILRQTDRDKLMNELKNEGLKADPTPYSPFGMRLQARGSIAGLKAFKDGRFEVQDEASQLVGLLLDARPGMRVVDFCAGAGGKSLVIAATMENKGKIIACDVLAGRLKRARDRFTRAGIDTIELKPLTGENDPWVKRQKGGFDRVLVDAPCSGTGTWRRNPDTRWRSLGPGLDHLIPLQASILARASTLVKPGGRLVYATCSLLYSENRGQIEAFLAEHPGFRLVKPSEIWDQTVGRFGPTKLPVDDNADDLVMTPARHHTDGFYACVLERSA